MAEYVTSQEVAKFHPIAQALFRIETGSNWRAVGPDVGGDRAYGIAQVMGANIPSWTKTYYGRRLTPLEYLNSKEAQLAVINGAIGDYERQFRSDPEDIRVRKVAAAWFGGPEAVDQYDSPTYSDGYTDMRTYTTGVLADYRRISNRSGSKPASTGTTFTPSADSTLRDLNSKPARALATLETASDAVRERAVGLAESIRAIPPETIRKTYPELVKKIAIRGGPIALAIAILLLEKNPVARDEEFVYRGERPLEQQGRDRKDSEPRKRNPRIPDIDNEPGVPPGKGVMYWPKGRIFNRGNFQR